MQSDFKITNNVLTAYTGTASRVVIPDTVRVIGYSAFENNESIEEVILPDGLEFIGERAFQYCRKLTSVRFPDSLESIEQNAFSFTPWIRKQKSAHDFVIVNGILIDYKLYQAEIHIPEGVKTLGGRCFCGHYAMKHVFLPESLEKIGKYAFMNCKSLEKISFSSNLKIIDKHAFHFCSSLNHIVLPENVRIRSKAFSYCKGLTDITFPDTIRPEHIASDIFCDCIQSINITYQNFTFPVISWDDNTCIDEVLALIQTRNLSGKWRISKRNQYHIIWQMFFFLPPEKAVCEYVKDHFPVMFCFLIDESLSEFIQKILDSGNFITKDNIDEFIQYAIDKNAYEIQLTLMHYKTEKIGYDSVEEIIRKKFTL